MWLYPILAAASVGSCATTPVASLESYVGVGNDHNTYLQVRRETFGLRADARQLAAYRAEVQIAALCSGMHVVVWDGDWHEPAGRLVDGQGNSQSSDFVIAGSWQLPP
jgi:hypothetical protein